MKTWKQFEHWVVWQFRDMGWPKAKRNFGEQFEKKSGRDILNTDPLVVQVGYGKTQSLIQKFKQARGEVKKGEIPLAIVRKTEKGKRPITYAIFEWKDIKEILKIWRLTEKNLSKNNF